MWVKDLDYVSCWFMKGASFVNGTNSKTAFVSTNSIIQGEQVPMLWKPIFSKTNVHIDFAYKSFLWTNNAKNKAAVFCVIIGLSTLNGEKVLYNDDQKRVVSSINPYLMEGSVIVEKSTRSISGFTENMYKGSYIIDDGNLVLSELEKEELLQECPKSKCIIKKYQGAQEFLNGQLRYCLYITDDFLNFAKSIPSVNSRLNKCKEWRSMSKQEGTAKIANYPHRYFYDSYKESEAVIIPVVSSARRKYIPIGYVDKDTVIAASACRINSVDTFLLGIIHSYIHVLWVNIVGGKLKNDYRYSAQLCYNTFPFPKISDAKKQEIEDAATDVLMAREPYLTIGKTLADLYDPDKMPDDLREAHHRLDDIVESCYPGYPFATDEARLECLFKMYEKMTKK